MLPAKIPDHDPQQTHSFKGNHKNLKFSKNSSEKFSRNLWVEIFRMKFFSRKMQKNEQRKIVEFENSIFECKSLIKKLLFLWPLQKSRHIHHQHFVNNVVLYYMDWLNKATGSMLIEFSTLDVSGSCLGPIDNLFLQSSWLYFVYISCTIRVTWPVHHMTLNYIKHLSKRCEFCSINIHKKCMPQG